MFNTHFNKHFTLEEARSHLPTLKRYLPELQRIFKELKEQGFDIYSGKYRPGFNPDTLEPFPHIYRRFLNLVNELVEAGIQIKSIESGLVDFPALRPDGQEVFLCWQLGEEDIYFWHEIDAGFVGRKSIETF